MPTVEDSAPPTIRIVSPQEGQRIESSTPTIEIAYGDDASGPAVVTFRVIVNGVDYSAEFDHHSLGATGTVSRRRPLPIGENRMVVEIADRNGNVARREVNFINASGGYLNIEGADAPRRYVELVMDASGSMRDQVAGTSRMIVARDAVKELVNVMPPATPLGLRVFRGCDDIESLVPIEPVAKSQFIAQLETIEPDGGTPIVASLLESFEALKAYTDGERAAVLVTDGGESCGGKLAEAITVAQDAATRVFVIGFDIEDAGITEELAAIAEQTHGAFIDANRPDELVTALKNTVLRVVYTIVDAQNREVAVGFVDAGPIPLPYGSYEIRFDTTPPIIIDQVKVGRLTHTDVRLVRTGKKVEYQIQGP